MHYSVTVAVQPGLYEIQHSSSLNFLDALEAPVYNGVSDDALNLVQSPSRLGKWEITRIGEGYIIKQLSTGLFCALPECKEFLSKPVVLSPMPTVWAIQYIDSALQTIRISWSAAGLCWDIPSLGPENKSTIRPVLNNVTPAVRSSVWQLKPLGSIPAPRSILPGIYALQNKASGTYVSLDMDEKNIGCWPEKDLEATGTKLWEITPLGGGYTIKLHGTDKFCTLRAGANNGTRVSVSTIPAN